jgi:hypothetical protein
VTFVVRLALATALIFGAAYSTSTQFGPTDKTPMVASGDPIPVCPPQGCKGGNNF